MLRNLNSTRRVTILLLLSCLCLSSAAMGQDSNFEYSVAEIERIFRSGAFEIHEMADLQRAGTGAPGSNLYRAKKATLLLDGNRLMKAKWKTAPAGGEAFNNQPRYEIAAYELQKLFLEPEEYVVPPTVLASLPVRQYQVIDKKVVPTLYGTRGVIYMMQYWLNNVSQDNIYDESRFESDPKYARHLGNMNILSYLIKHMDSNIGNFLISTDPENPRVFAVDNGVSFGSEASSRGTKWQKLRVRRLPETTIERLRAVSLADLEKTLGVVAQFSLVRGLFFSVDPTPNLKKSIGLRLEENLIQFGLTDKEIEAVYRRLSKLLRDVDDGKIQTF